jgi:hypothetical protein
MVVSSLTVGGFSVRQYRIHLNLALSREIIAKGASPMQDTAQSFSPKAENFPPAARNFDQKAPYLQPTAVY